MPFADLIAERNKIDARWVKASIAGSMWAASEIVLGSFLHNLRVPFSGSILTAIGIILLISISYKWDEKGLFWRAGLICALMKTLSPSAVIFGPMIAIISEAILIELSVSLLGRNYVGYISGAILAMSWSLLQRILTLVIFYGTSIIEVYTSLADMAERQTGIEADIAWLPILMLLLIDAIVGLFAALAGIKLGRRITRQPQESAREIRYSEFKNSFNDPGHKFPYSISWLFFNLVLIIGSMIILNYLDWPYWIILVPLLITMWSIRYRRALRQLMNLKFWILFILVTMLTSFVFTRGHAGEDALWIGLKEGLRMNFRAGVIIIGLSVLGTELYNPLIRNFFARSSYRNLSLALELSVESLPLFIRSIPGFKTILQNPVAALHNVVAQATKRLQQLENKKISTRKVFILTGGKGEGKTTFAKELKEKLSENNIELRGILTEKVIENGLLRGYDLFDIRTGKKAKFLRLNSNNSNAKSEQIGKYEILPAGLKMGREILCSDGKSCIIIDEVGKLELDDRGWSECINILLNEPSCHLIMTVRDNLVDEVIQKWKLEQESVILNIAETDIQKAANIISYGCNFS